MTAKEYLSELDNMRDIMRSMQEHIEELYGIAGGLKAITYDKDRVQTSPENRFEKLMVKVDEAGNQYATELAAYTRAYDQRRKMINALRNRTHSKILRLRYLDGKRWEEIAVATGYTFRHVTRLHGEALQAFTDKYKHVLECP